MKVTIDSFNENYGNNKSSQVKATNMQMHNQVKATNMPTHNQPTTSQNVSEMTDEKGNPIEQAYQVAVNKLNEFMDFNQKSSKFVFHKDLERYYVEVVDSQTQEVVKEIPPKELLDAYYEMQKLAGKIFDTQA